MSISKVGIASNTASGASSVSISYTATSGNLLFVVCNAIIGGYPSVSDGVNTYNLLTAAGYDEQVWYVNNCVGGLLTIVCSGGTAAWAAQVIEFSGASQTAPIASAEAAGSSSGATAAATNLSDYVVGFTTIGDSSAGSLPTITSPTFTPALSAQYNETTVAIDGASSRAAVGISHGPIAGLTTESFTSTVTNYNVQGHFCALVTVAEPVSIMPAPFKYIPPSFVTRSGTGLVLNGAPYVFLGLNIPQYAHDGPTWASMVDIAASGANVIRLWWFQTYSVVSGVINFATLDTALAAATANSLKIILTLTDVGDEACDLTWWQGGYATEVASGHVVPYQSWVTQVVSRYANNPTILMWQLVNEAEAEINGTNEVAAYNAMNTFASTMGALVKGIDSNHLLNLGNCLGFNGNGYQWGGSNQAYEPPTSPVVGSSDYQLLLSNSYLDMGDFHDYGYPSNPLGTSVAPNIPWLMAIAGAVNKPVMIAECGIDWTNEDTYNAPISPNTLAERATLFQAKFSAMLTDGISGILVFSWRDNPQGTDGPVYGLEVGPSDPLLAYMNPGSY